MKTPYFFVYGTLKQGHGNNTILGDSTFVGEATTVDPFVMIDGGFPYVLVADDHPSLPVVGEVYMVDNLDVERRLDWLEGVAHDHYVRDQRMVVVNGEQVMANIYIASDTTSVEIVEGILHDRRNYAPVVNDKYVWR